MEGDTVKWVKVSVELLEVLEEGWSMPLRVKVIEDVDGVLVLEMRTVEAA